MNSITDVTRLIEIDRHLRVLVSGASLLNAAQQGKKSALHHWTKLHFYPFYSVAVTNCKYPITFITT